MCLTLLSQIFINSVWIGEHVRFRISGCVNSRDTSLLLTGTEEIRHLLIWRNLATSWGLFGRSWSWINLRVHSGLRLRHHVHYAWVPVDPASATSLATFVVHQCKQVRHTWRIGELTTILCVANIRFSVTWSVSGTCIVHHFSDWWALAVDVEILTFSYFEVDDGVGFAVLNSTLDLWKMSRFRWWDTECYSTACRDFLNLWWTWSLYSWSSIERKFIIFGTNSELLFDLSSLRIVTGWAKRFNKNQCLVGHHRARFFLCALFTFITDSPIKERFLLFFVFVFKWAYFLYFSWWL